MKKLLVILLVAALALSLLTACGDASSSSGEPAAPAATNSAPQPQPQPESEPELPYEPAVLTGLPKGDDYPEGQRITAVMVNNISNSSQHDVRPQNGLSDADILIEIKVEGGITRFCALFTDYNKIDYICPVRSARDQFFQLFLPFQPVFIHIGESVVQTQYKKDYTYESLDANFDSVGFNRDPSRQAAGVANWEIAYLTQEDIQRGLEKLNVDTQRTYNSTFFDFVNYNEPNRVLTGGDALGIKIVHSQSYRTYFDWDAASGRYLMSQYSMRYGEIRPSTDANNGEQLGFENVLVLFTDFDVYPDPGGSGYDLQKVNYANGGVGYYFNGGKAEFIRWMKGAPLQPLRIVDTEGNEENVKINPGKTYIAVVDLIDVVSNGKTAAEEFGFNPTGTAQTDTAETVGEDTETAGFVEMD